MRKNLGIRRRLATLVENDRRVAELLYSLLFSLPGAPVLYYGDEILMGDNIYLGDRDAVRTPMQWTPDRNGGFSRPTSHSSSSRRYGPGLRLPGRERRGRAARPLVVPPLAAADARGAPPATRFRDRLDRGPPADNPSVLVYLRGAALRNRGVKDPRR